MTAEDYCPEEDVDAWRAISGVGLERMNNTSSTCLQESIGA